MEQVYIGVLGVSCSARDALVLAGIRTFAEDTPYVVVSFQESVPPQAWPLAGAIQLRGSVPPGIPCVQMFGHSTSQSPHVTVDPCASLESAYLHLRSLNPASTNFVHAPDEATEVVSSWGAMCESQSQAYRRFAISSITPSMGDVTDADRDRFKTWLRDLVRPAAICCTNSAVASAILHFSWQAGLNIPEDIALITCEESLLAEQMGISCALSNYENAGFEAAKVLSKMLNGEPTPEQVKVPGAQVIRRSSTDRLASLPEDIRIAQEYIRDHSCRGINVKDVMQTQKVSRVTFERRFKEYTGQTPGAEIRRIRIEKAADLLKGTELPVSEVASRCGFEGSSRFSLFFRKRTGLSPSEYRRRHSVSS